MKPHEGELEREISKVQKTVCELRAGFSRALLELNQIQQGDTELQSQLEDTRHGCNKRALHLESLVLSLKEELEEVRCQFHQLCETRDRKPPEDPSGESNQAKDEGRSEGAAQTPPLSGVGGAFLIHSYMQGLQVSQWARLNTAADELSCPSTNSCLRRGRRRGVVEALLHSERDYVSTLNQLCEKYSTQPPVAFGKHLDQMLQGHLMFRNSLEEHLSSDDRSSAAGKAFLNLTRQNNSFTDAYVGYVSSLPAILTTAFQTLQDGSGNTQEKERLRLLSLLFSPVSRVHTYLNIIQALTRSCGAGHVDWCALQDSEQVVRDLCRTCHVTLGKAGTSTKEEGPELGLRSRCWTESPDCGPSAFTKYCANSSEDAASVPAGTGMSSTSRQRKGCRAGISGTLPRANGILRNGQQRVREDPPGGWSAQYMWNGNMRQDYLGPICAPFPRDPSRILNSGPPNGAEINFGTGCKSLAMRVCGSPRLERHVYSSEPFPPHHPNEADTDCDRADGSIFDFSSVTTCSPDNTMSQLRGAEQHDDDDDDDDDDDGEDSKVPVLLKPSYSHNTPVVQAGGSLRTQWQIPRRAPIPSELRVGLQSKVCSSKPHRIPASAFRPIWDPSYSQADVTPAKDTTVSFSSTNQIINQQQECDQSRSPYRSGGVQRAEAVWRDSEDSDGPCSTV